MLRALLLVCALSSHAMADSRPVLDKLEKNAELSFSMGFNLVATEPELLFWIAADRGASVDSIHALGKKVDEMKKTKQPALEIRKGEIFENGKPTGVRIVAYEPRLTLSFRGQHWTFDPKATLEANFESVQKFMHGKGSSALLSTFLERAHASDAVQALSPNVQSSSGWRAAAIVGGAGAGSLNGAGAGALAAFYVPIVGVPVGGALGGVGGALAGGYGAYKATQGDRPGAAAASVCDYIKSVEGNEAIMAVQDVEYSCTKSAKTGTSLDQTLNLEFRNGPRKSGISIDYKSDPEKCCQVYLTQQPSVKLGKITPLAWTALQEDTASCARPITIQEARPRTKKAFETLRMANGFCKGHGAKPAAPNGVVK